jgi:hypothetical protein
MVTIQSWILMCLCTSVPSAHFAQWYEDHLRFISLPNFLFVTGITLLYWVIPVQLFITLVRPTFSPAQCFCAYKTSVLTKFRCTFVTCNQDDTYSSNTRYAIASMALGLPFMLGWFYWLAASKRTLGTTWTQWLTSTDSTLGAMGIYLPRKQLHSTQRTDVPYF